MPPDPARQRTAFGSRQTRTVSLRRVLRANGSRRRSRHARRVCPRSTAGTRRAAAGRRPLDRDRNIGGISPGLHQPPRQRGVHVGVREVQMLERGRDERARQARKEQGRDRCDHEISVSSPKSAGPLLSGFGPWARPATIGRSIGALPTQADAARSLLSHRSSQRSVRYRT